MGIIAALAALIYAQVTGGRKRKKRRKRSPSNPNMLISQPITTGSPNSLNTLDGIFEGIGSAYKELWDETRIMVVKYEPLETCPVHNEVERCASFSWTTAGGLINRTLLPPIEAFGQECF